MKKLAARDFEDILQVYLSVTLYLFHFHSRDTIQCAFPAFENLFEVPAHNKAVLDLLFVFAEWHTLAKLRLHHTSTLIILNTVTQDLGRILRHLTRNICPAYDTQELPREEAARKRRASKQKSRKAPKASGHGAKKKTLNLATYKYHSSGDYGRQIITFGTTDSYSTQIVRFHFRYLP